MRNEGGEFAHGYTYSGHPAVCAVALANIEALEREGVIDRVRETTAPRLAEGLASLEDHPLVGEARSIGLMGAVEIVADRATGECFDTDRTRRTMPGFVHLHTHSDYSLLDGAQQIPKLVRKARHCLDLTADWLTGAG